MKKTLLAALLCSITIAPAYANMGGRDGVSRGYHHQDAMMEHMMGKMDTNHDGVVSMGEHESFSAHMFYKADANRDLVLTHDEIAACMQAEEAQWRGEKDGRDAEGFNQ